MHLYFTDRESAITKDMSNWAMDDEIYYDMDLMPDVRGAGGGLHAEGRGGAQRRRPAPRRRADRRRQARQRLRHPAADLDLRAHHRRRTARRTASFVSIPGHLYENFNRVNYRAILLRGIAWAGKRANVDELLKPEERGDALRYVEGGPTAPSKAAAKIEVHPEFDLTLVAAEPLIDKAMNIDWDEQGPALGVGNAGVSQRPPRAQHRAVEGHAGRCSRPGRRAIRKTPSRSCPTRTATASMDRKHVFADKLELVTGFVFHRNGVIAATAPDIWYLEDTNGDEVADKRTKLYTGLGTADTHAVINNLRWGLDGWIYATHGYSVGRSRRPTARRNSAATAAASCASSRTAARSSSTAAAAATPGASTSPGTGRCSGRSRRAAPCSSTPCCRRSCWRRRRIPGTTSWKGMITNQNDLSGDELAGAGLRADRSGRAVHRGGGLRGLRRRRLAGQVALRYFTGEPTLNIVHQQFVTPDGVSYTTRKEPGREETEFIRSRDLWFRPIETRVGPDGALYVVDFYNQAVIHNDTRGPLHGPANAAVRPDRDHYFGADLAGAAQAGAQADVPVAEPSAICRRLAARDGDAARTRR